jgi:replicative DNA helicase
MKKDYTGRIDDKEIEEALLALLINHSRAVKIHLPEIQDDYFWNPANKRVFQAVRKIVQDGEAVDTIAVAKEANIKNAQLIEIIKNFSSPSAIRRYIKSLKDLSDKRWLIQTVNNLDFEQTTQEVMTNLSTRIIERLKERETEKADVRSIMGEFETEQRENEAHIKSGSKYIGMECGYPTIDQAVNGVRRCHYWIVSAYTNTGKSYFLLNVTKRLIDEGKNVLFFSLEMSKVQNVGRLLGIETGIDPTEIERGCLTGSQLEDEAEAKAKLYDKRISIYTLKKNIADIVTTIYANHSTSPVDLVAIDYLQKIDVPSATSRYERYTIASDALQHLAQETGIPVIVASQVDNESAKNKNIDIIATKGSGDVGGDADVVLLLKKDDEKQDEIHCFIQKNRHGKKGACQLRFFDGGILSELDNYHN